MKRLEPRRRNIDTDKRASTNSVRARGTRASQGLVDAAHLPVLDRVEGKSQHHDIEEETVTDPEQHCHLHDDKKRRRHPDGYSHRDNNASGTGHDIGQGIEDAVAVVVQRDCGLAVAIDDEALRSCRRSSSDE